MRFLHVATEEKPAALYARVSTDEQAREGHSLDQHIGFLKDFCEGRGWRYVRIYTEEGASGTSLDRPKFDLIMTHAETRLFDAIVVYRLDRTSREASGRSGHRGDASIG